ncbi:pyridoxal phosphate-dependent aminotransferase [Silvibacterium dinghuense]|uniref:Pyridoxal phosphate-dependent aminotransferase n=1 Tax=Silvibacterium dinghuense TaxID=1560006 RepID=A0A4V1NVP2_9BACT|nr:pyridoxal phosphate-dependent aminotransferase [Silvibacterium dinghuense]RXS96612.1 pyridoxal phosphate-dependent aminotransferase [Silvibacterium dinghuense]GGG92237.1 aminotransferase [Silvibacterium dinghuense]
MAVDASALSRRTFFRLAATASALAAVPILTEPHLAQAQRRRFHMEAYPAGAIRIDANENPLGPCAAACTSISSMIAEGGRYDTDLTFKLAETFAAMEGLKSEYVMPYAGSSEPLHYTVLAFTSPEKPFVTADPGYEAGMRAADLKGAKVIKVPLTATHAHDVKAMVAADPNAGVIYICNPNNPTGTTTPHEDIAYALANKPKGSILLIDEAYIHFSDTTSSLDLVKADKDVIVLRTFSKIYGMAGIRCGFAIGRPDLLEKLQYFGMNAMPITAVAAATASLQDKDVVPQRKKLNAEIRSETFEWLTANNVTFIPSESNCFMMDTRRPGRDVMTAMAKQDVFIGRVWPVMPTWVRITVGTRAEMAKFQSAYKQVMNASNAELALPALDRSHRFSVLS